MYTQKGCVAKSEQSCHDVERNEKQEISGKSVLFPTQSIFSVLGLRYPGRRKSHPHPNNNNKKKNNTFRSMTRRLRRW